jgi:hypothetical protein
MISSLLLQVFQGFGNLDRATARRVDGLEFMLFSPAPILGAS